MSDAKPFTNAKHTVPVPKPWTPTIITADDLCRKAFPDPRWAIPGLIPEGTTLLCGKPKMGKSWMALGLGIAVASGGLALGKIRCDAGDVLYLSLEDNERRLKRRIQKILPDGQVPPRLHLTTEWPKVGEGCRAYLADWLRRTPDTRLVIIDTLKKIRPSRGNRDLYDADYEIGSSLQELSRKHGVAFLIVHHLRKAEAFDDPMDMISGSTGLTGSVDGSLVLTRSRGNEEAVLHISGRDIEDDTPLALKFDTMTAQWLKIGMAIDMDMTLERTQIIQVMRQAGGPITAKRAAAKLCKGYEAVRKLMGTMEKEGDIAIAGGDRRNGFEYIIPGTTIPTTNNPNLMEAGSVGIVGKEDIDGSVGSRNTHSYSYTLNDGSKGIYRTDTRDMETVLAELIKQYGDRLLNINGKMVIEGTA